MAEEEESPAEINVSETDAKQSVAIVAVDIPDDGKFDALNISKQTEVEKLCIRFQTLGVVKSFRSLAECKKIRYLALLNVANVKFSDVKVLESFENLNVLELGPCSSYTLNILSTLVHKFETLHTLHLETAPWYKVCADPIIAAVAQLQNITSLKLAGFVLGQKFTDHLADCTKLKQFILIPCYRDFDLLEICVSLLKVLVQFSDNLKDLILGLPEIEFTEPFQNEADEDLIFSDMAEYQKLFKSKLPGTKITFITVCPYKTYDVRFNELN